jgi:hypothetical protein
MGWSTEDGLGDPDWSATEGEEPDSGPEETREAESTRRSRRRQRPRRQRPRRHHREEDQDDVAGTEDFVRAIKHKHKIKKKPRPPPGAVD